MYSKRFDLLCMCLIVLLAACSSKEVSETVPTEKSPPATQQCPVSSLPSPAITTEVPTQEPSPSLPGFVPDTNIPDAMPDPQTMMANSTYKLYEDLNNIYFLDDIKDGNLYCINKTDKSVKLISDNCSAFTLKGSKIYYISVNYNNYIIKYDIKTGRSTQVKKFGEQIYNIAVSGDKIYFAKESAKKYNDEEYHSSLYSCNLDGTGTKKLIGSALSFCVYKNKLYYVKPEGEEGDGDLFVYDLKTRKLKATGTDIFNGFEIAYDKIYHNNYEEYDIAAGKNKEFITEDYIILGLCGQYVIYTYADDYAPSYLYAYDIVNNKYSLADISSLGSTCDMAFYTGYNCVYIDASGALYCLRIQNGKTDIQKVASLNNSN